MIENCKLIELPKIHDPRGNLTPIEPGNQITFPIGRVYYIYDIPGGVERGGHAHKTLNQLIIAVTGSFDVNLDDGFKQAKYSLNRANKGLYISPMIWRTIDNFSSGSVCLVLASQKFSESDYVRDYKQFLELAKDNNG